MSPTHTTPQEQPDGHTKGLIERLEAAEVGSRELDALVEVAVRTIEAARSGLDREHWAKWEPCRDGYVQDPHTRYASNLVTTSLDAALSLADRVLPGWVWNMGNDLPCWVHLWIDDRNYDGNPVKGDAATPALAICAAILRAKSCADADDCDGPGSAGSGQLSEVL